MSTTQAETDPGGARHRGPSLLAVAIVFVSLFVASLVTVAAMTGGGHIPSPFEPAATTFFSDHAGAVRLSAFLQFGAAVPLAIFTATATSRLRFLSMEVAGHSIALIGGTLAAAMGALSALLQWVLSQPGVVSSDGAVRAFHLLAFATGGPGFVVPFGLLVAGVSVSGGLTGKLPRWVMWFGLVIAAVAELSSLTIATPAAAYLLPAARFTGLVWLVVVGAMLPVARSGRTTSGPDAT
ncbi:MAG: hypothetical protein JWO86_2750 [Myxococcaceae bacterium]|nr:hypothetical protein [Myxococcaceae bacterium]